MLQKQFVLSCYLSLKHRHYRPSITKNVPPKLYSTYLILSDVFLCLCMDPHLHQLACGGQNCRPSTRPLSVVDGSVEGLNAGDFCEENACDLAGFPVMKIMHIITNVCIPCIPSVSRLRHGFECCAAV